MFPPFVRTILKGFGCIVLALLVILGLMAIVPATPVKYVPSSPLCQTYDEALKRFATLLAATPADVSEIGHPYILTHGQKTPQVFVLLHGLTNCPEQYRKFAEQLHAQGYNVIVPLTPHHGKKDVLTNALENLSKEDLLSSADEAIAIAHGLGDKVTLAGLSVNAIAVAWYAQNTDRIDRAILLSPFLGLNGVSARYLPYLLRTMSRLPNHFFWWNPKLKQNNPGPAYAYPRAPTKPLAHMLLLAEQIQAQANAAAPETKDIVVITSAVDTAINHKAVSDLADAWKQHSAKVTVYEFPAKEQIHHDMMDPHQPTQRVDFVYPELLKLFTQ
ncbi:MAG: alpha/beta fold hydrolase [Chthoniobacterales bacterium]